MATSSTTTEVRPAARASTEGPAAVADAAVRNLHRDGQILIGGEPTPEGLEALSRQGVRTVIDLRAEPNKTAAEAETARRLGLTYVVIPMESTRLGDEQAQALMEAMRQHRSGDVLIHCASGNRAAAAYGLYLGATGQCPIQEAMERARKAGMRNADLAESVRRRLDTQPAGVERAATRPAS